MLQSTSVLRSGVHPIRPRAAARRIVAALAALAVAGLPCIASAQLATERLSLLPAGVDLGPGTVRLDGMGGFETAVEDENLEISLWDYFGNPAGFANDRDAWNFELRYGHEEFAERDLRTERTDLKVNEGVFGGGFHRPGRIGAGVRFSYSEVDYNAIGGGNSYQLTGISGAFNLFLSSRLSAGFTLGLDSETESPISSAVYNIEHDNRTLRTGLGAAYHIAPGVAVGGRAELFNRAFDGLSEGDFHTDTFEWSRPGQFGSLHAVVSRGRLEAAAGFSRESVEGEESVRISWSERFEFNPTPENVGLILDTFTEDRTVDEFRARVRVNLVPRRVSVSVATMASDQDFKVVVNPNILGSLPAQDVTTEESGLVGGGSARLFRDRLLVAAEAKSAETKVLQRGEDGLELENKLEESVLRFGGEYFLGESVLGRLGVVRENRSYSTETVDGGTETAWDFDTTRLTAGLGVVPSGGIWQLDLALDIKLGSDLEGRRTGFGAYVRHLF